MATDLPARYEIRNLGPEHSDWAKAILCHTNIFYGPLWAANYKGPDAVKRCLGVYRNAAYLVDHQIESGYSFGVFDMEYEFKRPDSAATGGKCYWNPDDVFSSANGVNGVNGTNGVSGEQKADGVDGITNGVNVGKLEADALLEQMDFPLVSIALSYDSINPLDAAQMADIVQIVPEYGEGFARLIANDARPPASWQATAPLQVLSRNSTSTRRDYEGLGLMKRQAHWLMRWAAAKGFRGIQIGAFNDAVTKVWKNPPPPFSGEAMSEVRTGEVEVREEMAR